MFTNICFVGANQLLVFSRTIENGGYSVYLYKFWCAILLAMTKLKLANWNTGKSRVRDRSSLLQLLAYVAVASGGWAHIGTFLGEWGNLNGSPRMFSSFWWRFFQKAANLTGISPR